MDDAALGGRLPLLPPADLAPAAEALYDHLSGGRLGTSGAFRSRTGDGALIGPFNACLYLPDLGSAFLAMHEAEERVTPLSRRVREVIILTVGAAWASDYELYAHRAVAGTVGFSIEQLDALTAGRTVPGLDAQEQAAQRFADELARERWVSERTYAAAGRELGRDGVIAATFLIGIYGITCTLLNAFAVPAPQEG